MFCTLVQNHFFNVCNSFILSSQRFSVMILSLLSFLHRTLLLTMCRVLIFSTTTIASVMNWEKSALALCKAHGAWWCHFLLSDCPYSKQSFWRTSSFFPYSCGIFLRSLPCTASLMYLHVPWCPTFDRVLSPKLVNGGLPSWQLILYASLTSKFESMYTISSQSWILVG